jgi:hypothetical protein
MPTYTYRTPEGDLINVTMRIAEMEKRQDQDGWIVLDNGTRAKRVWESCGVPAASAWPKKSVACGVDPSQCQAAEAEARRLGVPTTFDRNSGDAIFTSAVHQHRYLKTHNMVDHDSYI